MKNLVEKLPQRQKVYLVPEIDWNKYYESIDLEDLDMIKKHKELRTHSLRQSSKIENQVERQNNLSDKSLQSKPKNELNEFDVCWGWFFIFLLADYFFYVPPSLMLSLSNIRFSSKHIINPSSKV